MVKARNRAGSYVTLSSEALNDTSLTKAAIIQLSNELKKKKGWKYLNKVVSIGRNNDDFIMDNVTIVLKADAFKKPRFVNA